MESRLASSLASIAPRLKDHFHSRLTLEAEKRVAAAIPQATGLQGIGIKILLLIV